MGHFLVTSKCQLNDTRRELHVDDMLCIPPHICMLLTNLMAQLQYVTHNKITFLYLKPRRSCRKDHYNFSRDIYHMCALCCLTYNVYFTRMWTVLSL